MADQQRRTGAVESNKSYEVSALAAKLSVTISKPGSGSSCCVSARRVPFCRRPLLALVHREPGHAAVGIRHYPGAGYQCHIDDGLAPLESTGVACRHDGYPHQQQEHAHL